MSRTTRSLGRKEGRRSIKTPALSLILFLAGLFLWSLAPVPPVRAADPPLPLSARPHTTRKEPTVNLTRDERAWLRGHPVITVVQDPGWPPVEFADERGEPSGISADYLRLVENRLGIKFRLIRNLSWQEAYERLKRHEIDMTTSVAVTPERLAFWTFTKPYVRIPIVVFASSDVTYVAHLSELSGKKVAVVDQYAVTEWLSRDFPHIQLVKVKDAREGLGLLEKGRVFAYIDNMLVVSYYLTTLRVMNVKIAGETPYVNAQCMAVRNDWPILVQILGKALDSISEQERAEIYRKWVPVRYEHGFNYRLLWQVLAVFALVLLGLTLWIRKLSKEIAHRREAEKALASSEQRFRRLFDAAAVPLCFMGEEGVLLTLNNRFVQTFGYTREDVPTLTEWLQRAYPDPEYRRWVTETWEDAVTQAIDEKTDIGPLEYRIVRKDGAVRTVVISGSMVGADLLLAFFDITERKEASEQIRAALREKEVLLKEVHHRVKNNLQIMSSLLNMQSRHSRDPECVAVLRTSVDRIRTMALIHDKLYSSESLARIYFPDYVNDLVHTLFAVYSPQGKVEAKLSIGPLFLEVENAMPMGLIINELVSNALKHAFPGEEDPGGIIRVDVKEEDNTVTVVVSDNGTGYPAGADFTRTETLGMQLVVALVEQLEGTITLNRDRGTEFRITFPLTS